MVEYDKLKRSHHELDQALEDILKCWARALELQNREPHGHDQRVVEATQRLAQKMGYNECDLVTLRRGVHLHDIGKMGIPENILFKTTQCTEKEWAIIRQHPYIAHQLLSSLPILGPALDIPYCHHEKWDGSGYPRGLKGEDIPLAARMFAVVDAWDTLLSDRPYRPAWSRDGTLNYIREQSGKSFDPQVVEAFLDMLEKE